MNYLLFYDENSPMETPIYIDVAVALPVDNTYVYKVPDHLKHAAIPGMRVLVPFGRRRITGYITGFRKDSGGYQARLILDLPDEFPPFPTDHDPLFPLDLKLLHSSTGGGDQSGPAGGAQPV